MHEGFQFSLAAGSTLRADSSGYYLVSELPVRVLRLNRRLFEILSRIREGGTPEELNLPDSTPEKATTLRVLFSLTSRGYLRLEKIAALKDHPLVSIIIPVRDQPEDLKECLESLRRLDYPAEKYEVIIVDDGSERQISYSGSRHVHIIRNGQPRGPAASRNLGARIASGELLAFLDADCIASADWLKETVPFFFAPEVAAVGGYVDGYHRESLLDRYEVVASSLNMGGHFIMEGNSGSTFYVPTANMLVRRQVFLALGGFGEDFHVGEDVDFCWRLREKGYTIIYAPFGKVFHKHRRSLAKMLLRRGQYGTSEAALYRAHRRKKKTFSFPIYGGLIWLAILLSVLCWQPLILITVPAFFALDLLRRMHIIRKLKLGLAFSHGVLASIRSLASCLHFASFHLVRYYLFLFLGLAVIWFPFGVLGGLMVLYTSAMDYRAKKAELPYPVFFIVYSLEQLAYQLGVLWGSIRHRYFGSYAIKLQTS